MKILVLQETDYLIRGPHTQHHIFERLSTNPNIDVTVLDYDMDKVMKSDSLIIKKHIYHNVNRAVKDSRVTVIRTAHIQVPYFRRISAMITNFFEILKIIRKERPDIIVGFSITNGLIGELLSKLFRIPYLFFYIDILHELVPIGYVRRFARVISRFVLKHSDYILVHTTYQKKYLENEGIDSNKVDISPDGISLENIEVDNKKLERLKSKFKIKDDEFIIFFMGYLYDFAGLIEIIEYYNDKVKNGDLNLRFLILGDGGVYNDLKRFVDEQNAKWVILAGRVPFFEITEYIELADLCLLSFAINDVTKEITPIKILEYMAMKKPVLSTALPGVVQELGKDCGVYFAKDQKSLISEIGQLVVKENELKERGLKGFSLVNSKFSWKMIIQDFKKIIKTFILT
ncbi:MAG: glycosyltransferase [Candidatus Lokiarchaeota archaeon]